MGVTVLGPLTVDGSERLGPRDRVVLQALATRQGRPVSAEELMDALWRDDPPASAAKNLQSCIVRLRKALGATAIETSARGYAGYSPDGARLVTSGTEGTVAVWQGDTARSLARVTSPSGGWTSAEFLPDGRSVQIAPWGQDHAVYVWDTNTSHAIDIACRIAGRDLTRAEWQENFGDEPYLETCP